MEFCSGDIMSDLTYKAVVKVPTAPRRAGSPVSLGPVDAGGGDTYLDDDLFNTGTLSYHLILARMRVNSVLSRSQATKCTVVIFSIFGVDAIPADFK